MRFDLIDRVLESDDQQLTAVKCVTLAEEYLADHFPGFPVLPGVMMLETLTQAARKLLETLAPGSAPAPGQGPWMVGQVRNLRYGNMVRPGQSLVVTVTLRKHDADGAEFQGVGRVDEQVAVQGRFTLVPMGTLKDSPQA